MSASYQYIIESVIPKDRRDYLYTIVSTDPILLDRNKYIAGVFQEFLDNSTEGNFFKVLIANYLLEGLYFYSGFTFFYSLATRHLMGGTADVIKLINR
jgi:ribonucleoside-diphosphate reductase beta chain